MYNIIKQKGEKHMQPEVITLKQNLRKYRDLYMHTRDAEKREEYINEFQKCKVGLAQYYKK